MPEIMDKNNKFIEIESKILENTADKYREIIVNTL